MRMRALSIRDPWASLIRDGIKTIETRSWKTSYRGEIAIHRSSTFECGDFVWLIHAPFSEMVRRFKARVQTYSNMDTDPDKLPRRELKVEPQVIAIANLVGCVEFRRRHVEAAACPFSAGRFAWILDDITPIQPVKTSGRQGLFMVDVQVEELKNANRFYDVLPNLMAVLNTSIRGCPASMTDAEVTDWYNAVAGIVEDQIHGMEDQAPGIDFAGLPRLLISATTANYNFLARIAEVFGW